MAGSTYSSGTLASNTWHNVTSGAANRAVGQVNVVDSTSNEFYITGVQLEIGEVATPFEHEDIGTTLAKCQRYYYKVEHSYGSIDVGAGIQNLTTQARIIVTFPVEMRSHATAIETSSTAGDFDITHNNSVIISNAVPTYGAANFTSAAVLFNHASGGSQGSAATGRLRVADTFLAWSAEL